MDGSLKRLKFQLVFTVTRIQFDYVHTVMSRVHYNSLLKDSFLGVGVVSRKLEPVVASFDIDLRSLAFPDDRITTRLETSKAKKLMNIK